MEGAQSSMTMASGRVSQQGGGKRKPVPRFELTQTQKEDLKLAFDIFDIEHTGFITEKELRVAIRALGFEPKKEEIHAMVKEVDKDNSGRISFKDFLRLMTYKMGEKDRQDDIIKSFRLISDGTGRITLNNLKFAAKELGERLNDEELQEMITEADFNKDGVVDQEEFVRFLKRTSLIN